MRSLLLLIFFVAQPLVAHGITPFDAPLAQSTRIADRFAGRFAGRFADRFNDVQNLELPQTSVDAIKSDPISELGDSYHGGKGLAIGVGPDFMQRGKFLGESIQSAFVIKTLKQIFPDALITRGEFTAGWKSSHPETTTIYLPVSDTAESRIQSKDVLDMPILKAANPSLQALRKINVRSEFGIPLNKFAMSLYLKKRTFSTPGFPNAAALLEKAVANGNAPDIVFLTIGGTPNIDVNLDLENFAEKNGYDVVKLSGLSRPLEPGKRSIVLNDMTGKLPYLDRAADVSVRVGPINIFESLAVGTPTIYFENAEALTGYEPEAFAKMSAVAQKTGGAFPVRDIDDFGKNLGSVLRSVVTVSPPDAQTFHDYLEHLSQILHRHLSRANY